MTSSVSFLPSFLPSPNAEFPNSELRVVTPFVVVGERVWYLVLVVTFSGYLLLVISVLYGHHCDGIKNKMRRTLAVSTHHTHFHSHSLPLTSTHTHSVLTGRPASQTMSWPVALTHSLTHSLTPLHSLTLSFVVHCFVRLSFVASPLFAFSAILRIDFARCSGSNLREARMNSCRHKPSSSRHFLVS